MPRSLLPRNDIDFLIHDWLGGELAVDREIVDAILDVSERIARERFLPLFKRTDVEEPVLGPDGVEVCPGIADALKSYAEVGLFGASFPEELGGLGLPNLVCTASFAMVAAASVAVAAYPMLTTGNARLISKFGSPAQVDAFCRPQVDGRWFGTMCLSEPQAGSSLADIRTRAVADGADGLGARYRLTGNKMWISGGDHNLSENIVHLVLAKIPQEDGQLPEGTAGISLFIVPKFLPDGSRNDVVVAGLNHKMGYRGTSNCLLNFGESQGAQGWLVGEPGAGLRQMFMMMNEARVGVGTGAAALGYRGYRLSANYARERLQGRPIGTRSGSPIAIIEHPDVKRMLLQQKAYSEGALALCFYCARLIDLAEDDAQSASLLGLLMPVVKTWSSEFGLASNDIAIQIHGGYGYTRDFDVEQLWRDNRLNPIHEGTTGIQGIDLLGRKILPDRQAVEILGAAISATADGAREVPELTPFNAPLQQAWDQAMAVVSALPTDQRAFDNATVFLRAFGHIVVAWLWLDQAVAAARLKAQGAGDLDLVEGKLHACRYFFEHELPQVPPMLSIVGSGSDVASSAPARIF
ncbi:MAG: acyl-CoA dehydrogenase [Sphingomonadaceae bacterium]